MTAASWLRRTPTGGGSWRTLAGTQRLGRRCFKRATADPFFGLCEAIEALNGRGSQEQNQYSSDLCQDLAMPSVAGSDAHRTGQIGTAATEFRGRVGCLEDLLGLLRAGEYHPVDLRVVSNAAACPSVAKSNA